jgi:ATP-dependent Clp protease adaptor protein ClpS
MPDVDKDKSTGEQAATATATKPKPARKKSPARKPPQPLPPWKVMLHNDDKNDMVYVVRSIVELTPLNIEEAYQRMMEAHNSKVALLLTTHKERAELYREQFMSKGLTVAIEPA